MNWNARSNSTRKIYRNLTYEQVRGLILDGELIEEDWVQFGDDPRWIEVGAIAELADALPAFTFRRDWSEGGFSEDMDMTPMIDIVFQLLLFFMIISTFQIQKSIPFPAQEQPDEANQAPTMGQVGRDFIVVNISAEREITLMHYDDRGKLDRKEAVEQENLETRFKEIATAERKSAVLIDPDDQTPNRIVVAVIDAASLADMQDIRIAKKVTTEPGAE